MCSASGRISFAFGSVVMRRPCSSRAVTRLRSKARRCDVFRLSLRPSFLCLIRSCSSLLRRRTADHWPSMFIEPHAKGKAHAAKDFLNLVQRLSAEILGLQHFGFSLDDKLSNCPNVRILQAVVGAHGEFEFVHGLV